MYYCRKVSNGPRVTVKSKVSGSYDKYRKDLKKKLAFWTGRQPDTPWKRMYESMNSREPGESVSSLALLWVPL
jgi:hypothetical protein